VIVREGDAADAFYIVTGGSVEVLLRHPSGQEIVVNRLSRGDHFGEIALLRGGTRTATVRAAPDGTAELMVLDRDAFDELIRESQPAADELRRIADARLDG
jgi:CRP-like cAMP-binding protein